MKKTFGPDKLEGLCDLISRYIELCLISRHSNGIYPFIEIIVYLSFSIPLTLVQCCINLYCDNLGCINGITG